MSRTLTVAFLLLFAMSANSQPPQVARILDRFPAATCEDVSLRMDVLYANLGQNPGSTAVISIPESMDDPRVNLDLESMILGVMISRRYPADRVRIMRTSDEEKQTVFWVVPAGATPPEVKEAEWLLQLGISKPVRFYSEAPEFIDSICRHAFPLRQFIELLIANPKIRGNIVIREPSFSRFKRSRAKMIEALATVSRDRLRFFFERHNQSGEEYWLMPPKKRK